MTLVELSRSIGAKAALDRFINASEEELAALDAMPAPVVPQRAPRRPVRVAREASAPRDPSARMNQEVKPGTIVCKDFQFKNKI